jgi:hypothetical protein
MSTLIGGFKSKYPRLPPFLTKHSKENNNHKLQITHRLRLLTLQALLTVPCFEKGIVSDSRVEVLRTRQN